MPRDFGFSLWQAKIEKTILNLSSRLPAHCRNHLGDLFAQQCPIDVKLLGCEAGRTDCHLSIQHFEDLFFRIRHFELLSANCAIRFCQLLIIKYACAEQILHAICSFL